MRHTSPIHIRFADIDVMGHVNNAVYLNYFEQARMHWFKALIGEKWDWRTHGVILARNEIDYIQPVLLQDDAEIDTTVVNIGTKSLTLTFEVFRKVNGERLLAAKGLCVLVCFDHSQQKTVPVFESWLKKMQAANS